MLFDSDCNTLKSFQGLILKDPRASTVGSRGNWFSVVSYKRKMNTVSVKNGDKNGAIMSELCVSAFDMVSVWQADSVWLTDTVLAA